MAHLYRPLATSIALFLLEHLVVLILSFYGTTFYTSDGAKRERFRSACRKYHAIIRFNGPMFNQFRDHMAGESYFKQAGGFILTFAIHLVVHGLSHCIYLAILSSRLFRDDKKAEDMIDTVDARLSPTDSDAHDKCKTCC